LNKKYPDKFDYEFVDSLRDGLKPGSIRTLQYHTIFLSRRIIVIAAADFATDGILQMILYMITTIFMMVYLAAVRPFEDDYENNVELFNESVVLLLASINFGLALWEFEESQMDSIGIAINLIIGVLALFHIGQLTIMAFIALKNGVISLLNNTRRAATIIPKKQRTRVNDELPSLQFERSMTWFEPKAIVDVEKWLNEYNSEIESCSGPTPPPTQICK
jgi:hypothetical protein